MPIQARSSWLSRLSNLCLQYFNCSIFRNRSSTALSLQDTTDITHLASEKAEEALAQAKTGMPFQQIVLSQKKKSLWKVENLWMTADQLPLDYSRALDQLNPGDVVGPFKFYNGFHLIRLKEVAGPRMMKARHILIKDHAHADPVLIKRRLEAIRQDCLIGEKEFSNQAKQHSEDPNTVFKGGDLGWVLPNSLEQPFHKALETLAPGQISAPFRTSSGWHIVQLIEQRFLISTHPEWKRYVAKKLLEEKKISEAIENMHKELYNSAHIQWVDATFKPKDEN